MKHSSLIVFSGMIWLVIGAFLLTKGLALIVGATSEENALFWISIGLLVGFIKGRFVLAKSVKRIVERILAMPPPVALKNVYSSRYYVLIGSMMMLGMAMKWMPIDPMVRGLIDVAVGAALINGSILYFRRAVQC